MGVPRRDHRQHRVPGHPGIVPRGRRSRGCRGSSTRTHIFFAALLVPAGGSPTGLGGGGCSSLALAVFALASVLCGLGAVGRGARRRARRRRLRARRSWSRRRWRSLLPEFPLEQRATAIGAVGARSAALAAAPGPALGGVLVARDGWRSASSSTCRSACRPSHPGAARCCARAATRSGPATDILGIVLLVAGVGRCRWASSKGQDWGWGSAQVVGARSPPPRVALAAFVVRSARHPAPVIELGLLRVRSFAVANVGAFFFFAWASDAAARSPTSSSSRACGAGRCCGPASP